MESYVGLDVHSKSSVFVVQNAEGRVYARGEVATTPEGLARLRSEYGLAPGTPIGLETGTIAFYVARQLQVLELKPVVIDAREVRLKAHRPMQKSDRRDAFEICDGLRRGIYRAIVHVPPLATSELRETLSRRRHFVRLQTSQACAVKRLLRGAGLARLSRTLASDAAWTKLFAALPADPLLHSYIEDHHTVWRCARAQVVRLERVLTEQQKPLRAEIGRLQTVPGVGPIVALTTVAAFADVHRFPSAKHAASYAGLVPSTHQSGDCDRHGPITKRGSGELRAMLCEAAHQARRPTHPLHPYFTALCVRRGYQRAVTALAHRLCRILFAMLRDGADFDVRKLGIEEGPFRRTVTRRYRLKRFAHAL
jgi:transposase